MMDVISWITREGFIVQVILGLLGGTVLAGGLIYLSRFVIGISVLLYRLLSKNR